MNMLPSSLLRTDCKYCHIWQQKVTTAIGVMKHEPHSKLKTAIGRLKISFELCAILIRSRKLCCEGEKSSLSQLWVAKVIDNNKMIINTVHKYLSCMTKYWWFNDALLMLVHNLDIRGISFNVSLYGNAFIIWRLVCYDFFVAFSCL